MPLSRRTLFSTSVALAVLPAFTAGAEPERAEPDLATPEGWLDWITAHRDRLALSLRDTSGLHIAHRPDVAQPLASAVKAAHLGAYATAVAEGGLDPREQVRLGDWERFYVPTDGGGHRDALAELRVPTDPTGLYAADPEQRVVLERMVTMMIAHSDSAVPDFLRDRLGTEAVHRAAEAGGWRRPDVRSLCAEYLFLVLPDRAPAPGTPPPQRRAAGFRLERRYSTDKALRDRVRDKLLAGGLPPYDAQRTWAAGTTAGTAPQLAALHAAIAEGRYLPRRAGDIARRVLERGARNNLPAGVLGIGYKGGSLPGVLTAGLSVRLADGRVAAGALLTHGAISATQLQQAAPGLPLLKAALEPAWRDRLGRALHG